MFQSADKKVVCGVFEVLKAAISYKPVLTVDQVVGKQHAELKLSLLTTIAEYVESIQKQNKSPKQPGEGASVFRSRLSTDPGE